MENKLTAVEWLIQRIVGHTTLPIETINELISKSTSMEKEQIINAHLQGWEDAYDYLIDKDLEARQAEQYYNETYGTN